MAEVKVTVQEDPNLGSGPDEDASELSVSENDSDSGSVLCLFTSFQNHVALKILLQDQSNTLACCHFIFQLSSFTFTFIHLADAFIQRWI